MQTTLPCLILKWNGAVQRRQFARLVIAALAAIGLWAGGCQKPARTQDPQLKPIEEMLDQQLPAGTPESSVLTFLNMRGYELQPSEKLGTVVAKIRHIDVQTVQPVTARVTFYFDANRRLNTFKLQRTLNDPIPPPSTSAE